MKFSALALLLLASCASSATRTPASAERESRNIELASKLSGSVFKFRAFREDKQPSVVGFVELHLHACKAASDEDGPYVDCQADIDSGLAQEATHVQVQGDQRRFTARASLERAGIEIRTTQAWENQRWGATGEVSGADVHEKLSF